MEFASRHHETLVQGGMDRDEVVTQAPLLADTMRKIVEAILRGEKHIELASYNKKKGKLSKTPKKFPLPKIEDLPHRERKRLTKDAYHDALKFRAIDLKQDRIAGACREIQRAYRGEVIFSPKKLRKDAKMLIGAYFLFRKTDGDIGLLSTFETVLKNPSTGAFESSNILSALKTVLQSAQKNTEVNYKQFSKKLMEDAQDLLKKYPETKAKK